MRKPGNPELFRVYKIMYPDCGRYVRIGPVYESFHAANAWMPLWKLRCGNRPVILLTQLISSVDASFNSVPETL